MRRRVVLLLFVLVLAVAVTACGKKGPPKAPDEDKVSSVSIAGQHGEGKVSLDNRPLAAPDEDKVSGLYKAGQLCDD